MRSDRMAELLALSKSDHGVSGSNPADGEILSEAKRHRAFHVYPSIVLIWLKYGWKGLKTSIHRPDFLLCLKVAWR